MSANDNNKPAAALYCLDSRSYAPKPHKNGVEYGWIEPSQVDWYCKNSAEITENNNNHPLPSLAFFHIPLPEYNTLWDSKSTTSINIEGVKKEKVSCPKKNTGLFSAMLKNKDVMGTFVGHDHDNDYTGVLDGIMLSYGRKFGACSYGSLEKGTRVIELTEGKNCFDTWIRNADGKIVDKIRNS